VLHLIVDLVQDLDSDPPTRQRRAGDADKFSAKVDRFFPLSSKNIFKRAFWVSFDEKIFKM